MDIECSRGMGKTCCCVARITCPSLNLDTYTLICGLPGLGTNPLVGRFMVGDLQSRLNIGALATPPTLPLNDQVCNILVQVVNI
jgi:hypothetical protein